MLDRPGRRSSCRSIEGHVRFENVRFGYGKGADVLHGDLARRPRGHDGGPRRPHRRGQVDDREAARALLRARDGPDHDRRARPQRRHAGVAAPPARCRAAGGLPLRRHGSREHRLRQAGRDATRRSSAPRRPSARTTSSSSSRTATRRTSRSAAPASRAGSASSSRSLARCSPIRASSSSTRRPRRSTSAPSGRSRARCGSCSRAGRRSSSRTGSRRSASADLIVVLEHGQIVEQGTHDELLAAPRPVHVALRRLGCAGRVTGIESPRGHRRRSRRSVGAVQALPLAVLHDRARRLRRSRPALRARGCRGR